MRSFELSGSMAGVLVAVLTLLAVGVTSVRASDSPAAEEIDPLRRVVEFAGGEPERCVFSSPGLQLCSWGFEGKLIGSDDPNDVPLVLNLICELSIEASAQAPVCQVHAVGPASSSLPDVAAGGSQHALTEILERIPDARTTTVISRVLGEIPAYCRSGAGVQRCGWLLPVGSAADATAVLQCELPIDGTPTTQDSCGVTDL